MITIDGGTGRSSSGRSTSSRRRSTRTSSSCSTGPTTSAGSRCARTPTRLRTPPRRASSAPQGIGLCRTEHMFMVEDRLPLVRAMIMASAEDERREALAKLLPLQQEDFEGIFEAMAGLPVTIRLLDPPLHEFLPSLEEAETPEMSAAHPRSPRGEPDARDARLPARTSLPRDLRDAGAGDHPRRGRRGRANGGSAARRDHASARRLRRGAPSPARAHGANR